LRTRCAGGGPEQSRGKASRAEGGQLFQRGGAHAGCWRSHLLALRRGNWQPNRHLEQIVRASATLETV